MVGLYEWGVTQLGRVKARYHRKKLSPIQPVIDEYSRRSSSTGAKHSTIYHLYNGILHKKPNYILECGTGLTTLVICEAILALQKRDSSYQPIFVSMESEAFYFNQAVELLPERYRDMVDLRLSPAIEDRYAMFRGIRYAEVPEHPYDFVFVDGPSYKVLEGGYSFCFDFIKVLSGGAGSVDAVIDTRVSTVYVLQQLLGRECVRYDSSIRVGFIRGASLHKLRVISEPPSSSFKSSLILNPGEVRLK